MASTKLIKGILGALDEKLGTGLFKAEGRSLAGSGAKLVGRSPVRGILAKPAEPLPESVHPDFLKPGPPLEEVYHGTNRRANFDRPGAGFYDDFGLHLTSTPMVSDFYALNYDTPDLNLLKAAATDKVPKFSLAGPRVYPMYADPGNKIHFPADAGKWVDPEQVADSIDEQRRYWSKTDWGNYLNDPIYEKIIQDMRGGKPVGTTLTDLGYHSVGYPHYNPIDNTDSGQALMLLDPSRAVPKYSEVGQQAAKVRGVLAPEKIAYPDITAQDIADVLGPEGVHALPPEEFLYELWNPTQRKLMNEIDHMELEYKYGQLPPNKKAALAKNIQKLKDKHAAMATPESIQAEKILKDKADQAWATGDFHVDQDINDKALGQTKAYKALLKKLTEE